MKLTFLGQSGFHVELGSTSILIDPFIDGNPLAVHSSADFSPQYIIITHAHLDHYGDTEKIAKASGATLISNFEIVNQAAKQGLAGHPMNPGGGWTFDFGRVTFTHAIHSSSFDDGTYGGNAMGVVIEAEGKRIYHAGDTALFSDMQLIGRKGLDIALLPIGDNFTMGPEDALDAVKLLKPKQVVPIHYNTFGYIETDPQAFKASVAEHTSATCTILNPGEALEL